MGGGGHKQIEVFEEVVANHRIDNVSQQKLKGKVCLAETEAKILKAISGDGLPRDTDKAGAYWNGSRFVRHKAESGASVN